MVGVVVVVVEIRWWCGVRVGGGRRWLSGGGEDIGVWRGGGVAGDWSIMVAHGGGYAASEECYMRWNCSGEWSGKCSRRKNLKEERGKRLCGYGLR